MDIRNYPIFEAGTWNKMEFTESDLSGIAAAFKELGAQHQVPLKLGHNDEQPLTDGQPALGWVRNLRKVGKQLVADFESIPQIIKELIKKKRFRAVSIELIMGLKRGDKTYKHVLDAVAILGAEQPAVYTLPDLNKFLAKRSLGYDEGGQRVTFERRVEKGTFTSHKEPGGSMDEEEIKKLINAAVAPLNAQLDTLRTENSDLKRKFSDEETKRIAAETVAKTLKAEDEERAKTAKKASVKFAREKATTFLEDAVKAKKITPAQRDAAIKMSGINDDARVEGIELEDLKAWFSISKEDKRVLDGDKSTTSGGGDDEETDENRVHKDVFKEVDRRIRLTMGENSKLNYRDASRVVFSSDPALHSEYLNTNPPERMAAGGER